MSNGEGVFASCIYFLDRECIWGLGMGGIDGEKGGRGEEGRGGEGRYRII